MKKLFAVLVAVFIFCSTAVWAEEETKRKTFSISGELGCFSSIVVETTGEIVSKKPGCEPSVTLTHNSSGMYVSALGYYLSGEGLAEIDLYLGKAGEIKGVKYDAGVGFYNLKSLGSTKGDLIALYLNVEFPEVIGVTPLAYIEADIPTDKNILEGGWIWKAGAKKDKIVKIFAQPIDLKIEAGGNDGICGYEPEFVSFARGTISTEVEKLGMKFIPSLALQKGFGGIAGKEWRAVAGLAILFE